MNDYKEVRFNVEPPSEDACDLLAAALAEEGYESFVTAEDDLGRNMDSEISPEER